MTSTSGNLTGHDMEAYSYACLSDFVPFQNCGDRFCMWMYEFILGSSLNSNFIALDLMSHIKEVKDRWICTSSCIHVDNTKEHINVETQFEDTKFA